MKRHFLKSLMALCAGAMTLCATSFFTSCERLDLLEGEVENLQGQIDDLDARVKAIEELKTQLAELTRRVENLESLQFQVASGTNELQYSFDAGKTWLGTGIILATQTDPGFKVEDGKVYFTADGGKTWVETGAVIVDPCTCPKVELVDNGDSVTIKVGDAEFTIEKPEEIVFDVKAGKVYVESEGSALVTIKTAGVDDVTVIAAPKGWYAGLNADGYVEVTAPNVDDTEYSWQETADGNWVEVPGKCAASGFVKIHACGTQGKCMIGKFAVEVSATPVVVKAYGGRYEAAIINNEMSMLYYGACKADELEATVGPLIEELEYGYSNIYEPTFDPVSGNISELLGNNEPETGQEYVVWGVAWSWYDDAPTMEDVVLAYYTPVDVVVTEDESQRTPFDNYISINVEGADSYYALAVPASYAENIDYCKQQMIDLEWGGLGKLYNESYEGSLYQITAGTQSYVGEGVPGTKGYLLILPIDGRPTSEYTVEDVKQFEFSTKDLEHGGTVSSTGTQVYEAEKYNNKIWDYEVMPLDRYTELAVSVAEPAGDWKYFYFGWVDDDYYNTQCLGGDAVLLVNALVNGISPYPVSPDMVDDWPNVILNSNLKPLQKVHFVAFFLDADYKVGELIDMALSTDELVKSDIEIEPVTNVVEGILKNTTTLEITPNPSSEASQYKYIMQSVSSYNPYEGKTDAEMADLLFFDNYAKTITADKLVDGKFTISGFTYGYPYYVAVLPYDAEGKPAKGAYILEFDCLFELDQVTTDPAQFKDEPEVIFEIPENEEGSYGVPGFYLYGTTAYYEVNYTVKPVEGTTVASVILSPTLSADYGYDHDISDDMKASGLWSNNITGSSSYIQIKTAEFTTNPRYLQQYNFSNQTEALTAYILVSWVDTEGNYYYKEVDLSSHFKWMYNTLKGTETSEKPAPIVSPSV